MLPLYRDAQGAEHGQGAHAGLWYTRFFDQYDQELEVPPGAKTAWIDGVTKEKVGDAGLLQRYATRQQALVAACGGRTLTMVTDWHFVTGLGNDHPVENGFAWHQTLGVPYLTGAAVKGLLRAWCEVWEEGFDSAKILRWFGDTEQSGELIFFDAVPTRPVRLKADIMTPHYGDWYAHGADRPGRPDTTPADWHDPNPIPFLVVDKGEPFQFAVARRAESEIDLETVTNLLANALQQLGAGAKTATGYGRMKVDYDSQPIEQQIHLRIQQSDEKEIATMLGRNRNKTREKYGDQWNTLLNAIRDAHPELETRWKNSNNKNEKKAWKVLFN